SPRPPRLAIMTDPRAPTSRAASVPGDAKKVADLHALLEVSCQLGANSELGPLLQTIEQATLRVLDCERTTIFLYDRQADELYSRVSTGEDGIRFSAGRGIAGGIHEGLLPGQPRQVPHYAIAGWNRPTGETGGDFYDFQLLGSGTLAVTIADVTGHGVGPALIAAECRALLRASLSLTQNLERVLALVNDLLNTDLPDDRFVTAFVGLLEPAEHEFTYISAGHGPLFHFIAASNQIHELPPSRL